MEIIISLAGFIFTLIYLDGVGAIFLAHKRYNCFLLRISLGIIIISVVITIMGFCHILYPRLILGIVFSSYLLLFAKIRNNLSTYFSQIRNFRNLKLHPVSLIILLLLFLYLVIIFINTLTPPLSRDALNYHLYLPKIWLQTHKIYTLPNNIYSFFPGYWEAFYTYVLIISNDISAKLFHFLFTVLTLILIFKFLHSLQPKISQISHLLPMLVFLSTPVITKISTWAYLDLTFTFYALFTLYLLVKFFQTDTKEFFYLSAISGGYCVGLKYLGILWLLCLFFFFLEQKRNIRESISLYLKFFFLAAVIATPFYFRNYIQTGNPFFPFLYPIFDGKYITTQKYNLLILYFKNFGPGSSLKDLLLLPFRLSLLAKFDNPVYFDGKIGILYLLLGIAAVIFPRKSSFPHRSFIYIIIIYTLLWFELSQQLRFLIPVLVLLLIIYGIYLSDIKSKILYSLILVISVFYLRYPLRDFNHLLPLKFITGEENRTTFLKRNFRPYPLIEYTNTALPQNCKIMLLDTGPIAYYFQQNIFQESIFEEYTFKTKLKQSLPDLISYLQRNYIDFILINETFFNKFFLPALKETERKNFSEFRKHYLRLVYSYKDFKLYKFLERKTILKQYPESS